jgi:uncharacterized protein (TIGR03382 family)
VFVRTIPTRLLFGLALFAACDGDEPTHSRGGRLPEQTKPEISEVPAPLPEAHCTVSVDGIGAIGVEDDYLPHVIQCENGGANLEALKAQAVAARSVVYYSIETAGSICDGQGCQVYSCGADPEPVHYQAVAETSGMYLMYNATLTYGFYVAGDPDAAPPSCIGTDGAATTEHWITYNAGKTGTDVVQTELGFVHAPGDVGYGQNRGCLGQWSSRCLENDNGYDYLAILRFFYGEDIEIRQAQGDCVTPMGTTGTAETGMADTGGTTLDPTDASLGEMESGPMEESGAVDPTTDGGDVAGTAFEESDGGMRALPATYGENVGEPSGCGCTSDPNARAPWLVLALAGLGRRRRARARANIGA